MYIYVYTHFDFIEFRIEENLGAIYDSLPQSKRIPSL